MALSAFATVEDLQSGWQKPLTETEQGIAGELLLRATAQLSAMLAKHGIAVDDEDEIQAINLKTVTCNMVRRSMSAGDVEGLSSMSHSIGSTTASVQWRNPDGAFYLSKMDKEILGISGKSGYRSVLARANGDAGEELGW